MSQREEARLQVLNKVLEGWLKVVGAARVLGVSERHTWRLLAAYRKEGAVRQAHDDAAALAHGNRGRRPANRIAEGTRRKVLEWGQGLYQGVNHCHLTELLREREGIMLSRSTVRRILAAGGVKSPRGEEAAETPVP